MSTMLDQAIRQGPPDDRAAAEPREITGRPLHGIAIGLLIGLFGWVALGWVLWLLAK